MKINRRALLSAPLALWASSHATMPAGAGTEPTALPIPPLVDAKQAGGKIAFAARASAHEFVAGKPTPTLAYDTSYLGPTFRFQSGETVAVQFENKLDVSTTVHWHGLFIPSESDGGPHNTVAPGGNWSPSLNVTQKAATAWYHPHPHGDTARQVAQGLAGMIIVEDGRAAKWGLPIHYGVDDLPIVLQDRTINDDGQMIYDNGPMAVMHGSRGNRIVVNGAITPQAAVPRDVVRLRLLNGANARNFNLSFGDGRRFHVLATDNDYLDKPVAVEVLVIAPGERFEVLVDFKDGAGAELVTVPDHNGQFGSGMMQGMKSAITQMLASSEPVMSFKVDANLAAVGNVIPERLDPVEAVDASSAVQTRRFNLDSMMAANMPMMMNAGGGMAGMDHSNMQMSGDNMAGMNHSKMSGMDGTMGDGQGGLAMGMKMSINGKAFDMDRVDVQLKQGTTEIWEITGTEMAHPFHVHGASFRILDSGGEPPPAHLAGWKDTVLVEMGKTMRLLVSFDQPSSPGKPFMYHCHILEHEDAGMMGQFVTV